MSRFAIRSTVCYLLSSVRGREVHGTRNERLGVVPSRRAAEPA